ncbi:MAG: cytochrome c biogenesis protein CcdA [Alistipes sp.]|nr:cytochrome c biogenesis protein CcdA [Alistipes sp.]
MKNLFKSVVLAIALMLPFAVSAQDAAKTTGSVVNENDGAPVEWAISAEELEDGNFAVTLEATIAEGFHGYPMTDFSAPYFEFDNAEVVGDIVETLTPEEHGIDELTGGPSLIYYNKAIYVHTIKAEAGKKVTGYISATICTNDTNQCTSNPATFSIQMPGEAVVAAAEGASATSAAAPLDWGSIITAILWGFAALLTPCVFPMVPMTVSFFVKGSQSPAQGRFRATMYGVFIIALYVLPIAILVLLSNAFGTNIAGDIFNAIGTHWIPNLIFFVIFMIFAASFLGAFEITLPSSLVNKSDEGADKGGLIGIFFMALTLVLVSFSCTGPIVGSVIISSTSGGVWMPIITMAAFAIAFALPFTVLAWFPSLLKNLPKSGGWLNSVKVVLGFIEVALGLKFLMTADQTMHWGLLDREVYLAIWIVTFSLLGLYLLGKLRFAHDDEVKHVSVFRLTLAIGVFSFVVYMIPGMFGAPLNAISGYIPPMTTQDYQINGRVDNANTGRKYADFLHLPHQLEGHFDFEEAVADAKKQNKPIFVDVTGHACNNCREMETMVWSHSSVLPMLQKDFVICALYVDDNTKVEGGKRLGSINSKFAQDRWGVNAQPGYILLSPDGETVLAGPRGYDTNIEAFVEFLNTAKNAM